jgi:hypothetical protein
VKFAFKLETLITVREDDKNALLPMDVTFAGISMPVREDDKNVLLPMDVTLAGISMPVREDVRTKAS